MSLAEQVAALQEQLRLARDSHTRYAVNAEHAELAYQQVRHELRTEFGVESTADAVHMLGQLKADLTAVVAELNAALAKAQQ